jgi:hypothetical protein
VRHRYGIGAKTITSSADVIDGVTKTFAGLAGLIFMLLMIAQFIAYFNYTNMPRVAAVELAGVLERANFGALPLLVGHDPRDRGAEHHHPRRGAQVGDLRPGVHPDLRAPRRGPPDGAGRLPGR